MEGTPYTLAKWKVAPEQSEAFVAAWRDLAEVFSRLQQPPLEGTLVRSTTDPHLYYSFGPWRRAEDVAAMRADASAQAALVRVRALCEEASPGSYEVVVHVTVER